MDLDQKTPDREVKEVLTVLVLYVCVCVCVGEGGGICMCVNTCQLLTWLEAEQ